MLEIKVLSGSVELPSMETEDQTSIYSINGVYKGYLYNYNYRQYFSYELEDFVTIEDIGVISSSNSVDLGEFNLTKLEEINQFLTLIQKVDPEITSLNLFLKKSGITDFISEKEKEVYGG